MYANDDQLKIAIKQWSTLCLQRQFKVLKSDLTVYDICCVTNACPFRVHAYKGKWKDYWEVSRLEHHTCVLEQLDASHRNLTASFVANHMYALIVDNPRYEPKSIICVIEENSSTK